jgi:hypothetical protein
MCDIYASRVMTNSQLMDYMVSLHFIDFISWGVLEGERNKYYRTKY